MFSVGEEQFEQFVADAIDAIPDNVAKAMDNVAFIIEDDSPDGEALGAYDGIPIPQRESSVYPFQAATGRPDRIVLYKRAIERASGSESGVRDTVRRTLHAQVARLFGVAERELGWAVQ